jgi:hypothetical protein
MSSTLPYLQRQLKPRLLELAAQTDLQGCDTIAHDCYRRY